MGHAVGLVEDDAQELLFHIRGQIAHAVGDGLGIGADVGQGGAQLVGDIGHEFPLQLLAFALLGDVVDDHQHAAPLPAPVKGGHEQLEIAVPHLALRLQMVGGGQHLLQRGGFTEELTVGGGLVDALVEHPGGGGVGVDDLPLAGEGHHAVGHVEEQGVQLVALVLHLAQGVLQLSGHVVEGVGEHADLILGGHLDFMGEVPPGHPHRALCQAADGGDHGAGQGEGEQHGDDQAEHQGLHNEEEHLVGQIVGGGLVVQNIDDIAVLPPVDGDGHVHIVHGQIALVAGLPRLQPGGQGEGQVAGIAQGIGVSGGTDPALAVAVQDIQLAVAAVHAQLTGVGL